MFVPSRISSSIKQNFLEVNKKLFQLIVLTLITTHHSIIILLYKLILRAFRIHFTQVHAKVTLIYVLELYNERFRKEFENFFCVPGDFGIKGTKRLRQQNFDRINTIFQFKTNNIVVASNGLWPQRRCAEQEVYTYHLTGIAGVKNRLDLNDFLPFFKNSYQKDGSMHISTIIVKKAGFQKNSETTPSVHSFSSYHHISYQLLIISPILRVF